MPEPSLDSNPTRSFRLTFGQALHRGITLNCAYCGEGRLFRGLMRMHICCGECGTVFEREPGYFLGSTYINYGVTAMITTVSYVLLHFGLRWPNRIVMPIVLVFCLIFPVIFFRYARSLWLALDCFFDRLGATEAMTATGPDCANLEKRSGTVK